MARLVDETFSHPEWIFEPKLDGFRTLALLRRGKVTLRSRNGKDLTGSFPAVAGELQAQPEGELVLDGEVVVLNQDGLPDFGLIQQSADLGGRTGAEWLEPGSKLVYYVFDLLYIDGMSLLQVPLVDRKALLAKVVIPGDSVQPVEYVERDGGDFYEAAIALGLEGMVAKRRDSIYEPGARSHSWLKVKRDLVQEFVVGGYTEGTRARSATFGSLLVGYHDDGRLRFASGVGSGYAESMLAELVGPLRRLEAAESPFENEVDGVRTEIHWVRPEMVVQVKFAQWTHDGRLRAPVFLGVRTDLEPRLVHRETAEVAKSIELDVPKARDVDAQEISGVLEQLSDDRDRMLLEVAGHRISLTNLGKVLWPASDGHPAISKRDMIKYYARMARLLVPHLRDRPLTLTRYPDGIYGESFYQKRWEHRLPEFVETVRLFSSHNEGTSSTS